ncbi:MAG: phosphate acetyltransferase [Candidatus Nanopelagicales bacterium]
MARAVYLTSVEAESGKSLIALGLLEALSRDVDRVGYFRPVVAAGGADPAVTLVLERYRLRQSYEGSYGVTTARSRSVGDSRTEPALLDEVLRRYEALAEQCDVVVVEGTDFAGASAAFEFSLNADLARNLGATALLVLRAAEHRVDQVRGALDAAMSALEERGVPLLGVVVNRVEPQVTDRLRAELADCRVPVWYVPDAPELRQPTVRDVAHAAGARQLSGSEAALGRDVERMLVAGMGVGPLLGRLTPGALLIAAGDRADVITGALVARQTEALPSPAALLLTNDLEPDPILLEAIRGMPGPEMPVFVTGSDTFMTANAVSEATHVMTAADGRKLATALALVEQHVDVDAALERLHVSASDVVTPLMFEHRLVARAQSDRRRIVLPEGEDDRVLAAADRVLRRQSADLVILGDEDDIRERADSLGLDLSGAEIVAPARSALRVGFAEELIRLRGKRGMTSDVAWDLASDPSYFGVLMVNGGHADGMVSGAAHTTADTVRPALQIIRTRPGVGIVSSVFFMALADRVLVFGDCAVNPDPDASQLADIAISSAATAEAFGIDPRVAMLSYSTGGSGSGSAVDKVREATALVHERAPQLMVEGPLQFDAAVDPEVARTKLPDSPVAGRATVLVFPDLNTGNNTYKAVQRTAGAVAIGPVLQGLRLPVNDLSRGATVQDIVNTVVITAIQAQQARGAEA